MRTNLWFRRSLLLVVGVIALLVQGWCWPAGAVVGAPRPDAERVIVELLRRLDAKPELKDLSDHEFLRVVLAERRAVLQRLSAEDPTTFGVHGYAETLYPVVRFFRRFDLARRLMLELRRHHDDSAIRDWAFTELIDIERQQLLARRGRQLPESTLSPAAGWEPADVAARYAFGRGGGLFTPVANDARAEATLRLAMGYEDDAARLVQMGNKNGAVRMIDLAARHYANLHPGSPFAVGPLVWAARYIRDLGLPLAAIVRFQQILGRLGEGDTVWQGIVCEDLADVYVKLGQPEVARLQFERAMAAYRAGRNEEGANRVAVKLESLSR
ncbi:MAG: hypothetical protein OZSIB_1305 [Candidatus Ozemobacter sibiricus]|jgi:hypothetical protein|uniref:Tetratricopeptide repeat protein n=1 Tax=Candidatus Ozemobacter sibiricus TaxID=2268124 RepID=A0A367ZKD0_9BACT|nr:MAG: hypothetical protein OZSIB_1305 [Candidatus Ozemobacter sibiricus]